jgi:hypothetical protein
MSEDKSPGFTISDRRSFDSSGEPRAEETPPGPPAAPPPDSGGERAATGRRLPPVDFPTFVLSIGSSALINLGEAADPAGGSSHKDLPMAKHTIDILSMLEEKTKGNLSATEAQLLENLLFDLRLRYVSATKSK